MKLVDKYLLRSYLVPLAYCLVTFTMLYVIFDLFYYLQDFLEAKTPVRHIVLYYLFNIPPNIVYIVPVSLLLAALYTLSQLTKTNELIAMRACGLSIYRLMAPFIGVALGATLSVALMNELLGPRLAYWCEQFIRMQEKDRPISVHIAYNLPYKNAAAGRTWMIGELDTRKLEMSNVLVTQQRPDGSDEYKIHTRHAKWLDGRWWFSEVSIQQYRLDGVPAGPPKMELHREMFEFDEEPRHFIAEIKDPLQNPQFFSSHELYDYIRTHSPMSPAYRAILDTEIHRKLAMPLMCLIVTLLGIPFGAAQHGRKGAFMAIVFAICLFFAFYVVSNVGIALGKKQVIAPWLAGWLPNLLFFTLGAGMVYRMR